MSAFRARLNSIATPFIEPNWFHLLMLLALPMGLKLWASTTADPTAFGRAVFYFVSLWLAVVGATLVMSTLVLLGRGVQAMMRRRPAA